MRKIVVAGIYNDKAVELFKELCPEGYGLKFVGVPEQNVLIQETKDADYLFLRGRVELSDELLKSARNLKLMQKWGAGFDQYDMKQIGSYNIPFMNCAGINAVQVSEMTVALLLALYRRIIPLNRDLSRGIWSKEVYLPQCHTICGKNIGIIGIGNIGRAVARLMRGFGAKVQYYDAHRLPPETEEREELRYVELDTLFRTSDVITLHVPLVPETKYLVNRETMAMMKKTAVIINAARGGVVNEADLYEALTEGTIAGAALDVLEQEDNPATAAGNPLFSLDNTVITPHMGASTDEVLQAMVERCYENVTGVEEGRITAPEHFQNGMYFTKYNV